ncbi:MAG: AMP-binding protein [Synergistaceae bacterium]|jgi:acyl-[acyl-carrier-protein]-phospholipid O-acyltransferase/long-chain-fatty-acid--[acyl-carrier-protein] ligase|nr:AMP-binding protein [Synergistaceae bacterium]
MQKMEMQKCASGASKSEKFKIGLFKVGKKILKFLFRVEVRGIEHYRAAGKRVLILPNHVSLLDPVLAALFLNDLGEGEAGENSPEPPLFVVNLFVARLWRWARPFLALIRTWPVDPTNPFAMKSLIAELKTGGCCVVFPEGRISTTGGLMKIYDGAAMLADKTGAVLLPLRIEGAQFSKASYLAGKFPLRWFPKITLTFMPPRVIEVPEGIRGRKRRERVRIFLSDLMREAAYRAMDHRKTLFQALLEARQTYGRKQVVAVDASRKTADYGQIIAASLVLGKLFVPKAQKGERVGILLPGSIATVALTLGLSRWGRVPAMLNYTAGAKNIRACCRAACIKTIVTSRRFVEAGKFGPLVEALEAAGLAFLWLEDFSASSAVNVFTKIGAWLGGRFMGPEEAKGDPDAPALVLFTSGSEGTPKGVVLSHANVIANRNQLISSIDFNPSDVVMNAMPMFHVFGCVVGTLMPLLTGIRTFYYPTPLHYRLIPLIAYDIDATVVFGTDTFLYGYARSAHPYDFYRVRYAFAGAEKLRDRTRQLWGEKFGIRVIEGYGTTETSIISANTALQFRAGTVGRMMPGMAYRLDPVPGIDEGGRLFVKGTNVMRGYLKSDEPGVVQPPQDGWYDTGDIIRADEYGFLSIKGRAKRFAKVGGEMISLTALEEEIEALWPGIRHAVVALQDERKGEQLVLVTEKQDAERETLAAYMKERGYVEVSIPRKILSIPKLPLLGSGKTDYPGLAELGLAEPRLAEPGLAELGLAEPLGKRQI